MIIIVIQKIIIFLIIILPVSRFPHLTALAKKYLAPLPSSVASERLFSMVGDVLTDNRSRLLPERAEEV